MAKKNALCPLLALALVLGGSAHGASVLEEIRVFDLAPMQRYVFDLDRLALIELDDAALASGEMTVRLRDTALGFDAAGLPPGVTIDDVDPDRGDPLIVRIRLGRPIQGTTHFVLRQVSDLVLNLELDEGAPPAAAATASPEVSGEPTERNDVLPPDAATVTMSSAAGPATPEAPQVDLAVSFLPPNPEGETMEVNLPPAWMLGANDVAQPRPPRWGSQGVLSELASIDWPSTDLTVAGHPPDALGPDANAEDYVGIPFVLNVVPTEITDQYRALFLSERGSSQRAAEMIRQWIEAHPASTWNNRLLFLMAEHTYWAAREQQASPHQEEIAPWQRAIDDFRFAIRHEPDSTWIPLAHLRIADSYLRMGWRAEALAALERFQGAGTAYSVGTIMWKRAELLQQMGRAKDELTLLEDQLEIDPDSPHAVDALLRLGEIQMAGGNALDAYEAFRDAWAKDEAQVLGDPEVLTSIIATSIQMEDYEWALSLINHVFDEYRGRPENAEVANLLADLHRAQGDEEREIQVYLDMLALYGFGPSTLRASIRLADLGRQHAAAGRSRGDIEVWQYREPRRTYETVIADYPLEDVTQVAHIRLVDLLLSENEPVDAMRRMESFLLGYPDSRLRGIAEEYLEIALNSALDITIGKGDSLLPIRIHCEAKSLSRSVELTADNAWGLAQAYHRHALWSEAALLTGSLLANRQQESHAHLPWEEILHVHVESLHRLRRDEEALAAIEQRLASGEVESQSPDLLFDRARVLHSLGRWDETVVAVTALDGSNVTGQQQTLALFLAADAVRHLEGPDAAVERFVQALEHFQDTGGEQLAATMPYAIVFQLGDCFYQTGNWDLAGRVYTELLAVYPDSDDRALFQWREAQCLARTGQIEQAREALQELRTEQPETVWARLSGETLSDIDWLEAYPDLFSEGGVL